MSSKKIYTTVGLASMVMASLRNEARLEQRSLSFIVEKALVLYLTGRKDWKKEEVKSGDQIT